MVLQQLDQYKLSSRDLGIADKSIDVLDLSRNAANDVARYMFSDDSGPYKAPPYEKLMINTMNMVNYLVRRDLNGARVEARRLTVMQRFIREHEDAGPRCPDRGATSPASCSRRAESRMKHCASMTTRSPMGSTRAWWSRCAASRRRARCGARASARS